MNITEKENIHNLQKIRDEFKNASNIEKIDKGMSNAVYKFDLDGKTTYIKFGNESILKEAYATNFANKIKVPSPKIIKFGKTDSLDVEKNKCFLALNEIAGESLANITTKKPYCIELGKILKKMHTHKGLKFGWFNSEGIGNVNTWMEYLFHHYKTSVMQILKDKKYLSDLEIEKIANLLNKNISKIETSENCFLHADLNLDNIIGNIKKQKVVGIIDFDLASWGDPIFDLALCKYHHDLKGCSDKYYLDIYEGYNLKVTREIAHKIAFYNLASLIFKTHNTIKAEKEDVNSKKLFREMLSSYLTDLVNLS
ncbi:aminoglycoside phosphotransferase family protein [Patescibacteria group bacterium]|nr:aminoglycoside phosphotransferase family protein [Patescibacteria group bacterium]